MPGACREGQGDPLQRVLHSGYGAVGELRYLGVEREEERRYLVVPAVPGLGNDRFERGKLVVCHVEGAQKVLPEEGCARKGEEEGRGKSLSADEVTLRKRGLMGNGDGLDFMENLGILTLALPVWPVVHGGHHLTAYLQPQLSHFAFLDHPPVFSLSFPRCCTYSIPSCHLLQRHLGLL